MSDNAECRCFVGGLSRSTSDQSLKEAFEKFGHILEAKVIVDKFSGRSRGFGFVTFYERLAMEEAIEAMNGIDLDGRTITVDRTHSHQGLGRQYDNDRARGHEYRSGRGAGGGGECFRECGGGECFKCGEPGHFARECLNERARGGKYGGMDNQYGGGHRGGRGGDHYGPDRSGDQLGGDGSHYGPDRSGDQFGGRDWDDGGHGDGERYIEVEVAYDQENLNTCRII